MSFVSTAKEFGEHLVEAQKDGLRASANVVRNNVMLGLRGGYTTGNFVTGRVMNSVRVGEPYQDGVAIAIRVGTDLLYALAWELGHHNLWTRRYERVEVWRPALYSDQPEQAAAFAAAVKRRLKSAPDAR